jgi:hypothetical protein
VLNKALGKIYIYQNQEKMEKKIHWEADLKSALDQAKRTGRPVFLYIMNPPCPKLVAGRWTRLHF